MDFLDEGIGTDFIFELLLEFVDGRFSLGLEEEIIRDDLIFKCLDIKIRWWDFLINTIRDRFNFIKILIIAKLMLNNFFIYFIIKDTIVMKNIFKFFYLGNDKIILLN